MKRVVPCLDIRHGRTVKGIHFAGLADVGDPVELATRYADQGADELVLLDVAATLENRSAFLDVVSDVASVLAIPFTVGGGVSTVRDVERLLHAGADKVSINSAALARPTLIRECADAFGEQCVVVAIDTRWTENGPRVHSHGGQRQTDRDTREWAQEAVDCGAGELLVTSMDRDGTNSGYDLTILGEIIDRVTVSVIASGGAGSPEHICDAFQRGATAALLAGVLHRQELDIFSIKAFATKRGIPIRL